jgi:PHD/YefM family antitoxin component YafN of YafNO toxin-antitoxin module
MTAPLTTKPIEDLSDDAHHMFDGVVTSSEPVVLTRDGQSFAVMMGYEVFQETRNRLGLLEAIAKGERELNSGDTHDFDRVMAEAKAILNV